MLILEEGGGEGRERIRDLLILFDRARHFVLRGKNFDISKRGNEPHQFFTGIKRKNEDSAVSVGPRWRIAADEVAIIINRGFGVGEFMKIELNCSSFEETPIRKGGRWGRGEGEGRDRREEKRTRGRDYRQLVMGTILRANYFTNFFAFR